MQPEKIILIPPTHEQSVSTFHVEQDLAEAFLDFLEEKEVTPWQPPGPIDKRGPDNKPIIEIEIDVKELSQAKLEGWIAEFMESQPG